MTGSPRDDLPIVALACSAGGMDAVSTILAGLPKDFPAAVIVVRHHHPDTRSWLAEILQSATALPVSPAGDGDRLAAGHVYVAPAGSHTLMAQDDTLALIVSGDWPPSRPSADLLLTSLAVIAGPRAIAVVLSGHGSDGATGATAVHRLGGVVIASDETSSKVFAMPSEAINRDAIVDHIVPVGEIAALLASLVAREAAVSPVS